MVGVLVLSFLGGAAQSASAEESRDRASINGIGTPIDTSTNQRSPKGNWLGLLLGEDKDGKEDDRGDLSSSGNVKVKWMNPMKGKIEE